MKFRVSPPLLLLSVAVALLACAPALQAQTGPRVSEIAIQFVGPPAASESLIRANIRTKVGDLFSQAPLDADVRNLYGTGFFYDIKFVSEVVTNGIKLTYRLEGKPVLTDIKFSGNKEYKISALMKKITSKRGQPLDDLKLHDDKRALEDMYQKAGYDKTKVQVVPSIDQAAGTGTVTFEITESPKVKIKDIVFDHAPSFTQKALRKTIKTKRRWMFSFITGSGVLKEDQFKDDKESLVEFYQSKGYIDMTIKEVRFDQTKTNKMIIHIDVSEGQRYKVGTVTFQGNTLFKDKNFIDGLVINSVSKVVSKVKLVPGAIFTPVGLSDDEETVRDFYGSRGYIDTQVVADKTPNPATGTMDIIYHIQEGERFTIAKILIKGNDKTKDRVIRRELAVSPGEVYDNVLVKLSEQRLKGLDFFEKVETQPEDTDERTAKNLVIGVEEKNTGNVGVGAGFSSIDSLVGYVELSQENFDLFKPPTFTGAGQKLRLRTQIGTLQQDYELSFIEPWFLGRKLRFELNLFQRDLAYVSLNDQYDEIDSGITASLTRPLFGSENIQGTAGLTFQAVDLKINSGFRSYSLTNNTFTTNVVGGVTNIAPTNIVSPANMSQAIYNERGTKLETKLSLGLSYVTLDDYLAPTRGQLSRISTDLAAPLGGDTEFYKVDLLSDHFFKGLRKGHILEIAGRAGVAQAFGNTSDVPLFDRFFLGGLSSLEGFRYRQVGPRDIFGEPLGGDTYFFGSMEYSIPVIERVRVAAFYGIGNVYPKSFSFSPGPGRASFNDNWGIGIRLDVPQLRLLRFDYAFPLTHDPNVSSAGQFQFGIGLNHFF